MKLYIYVIINAHLLAWFCELFDIKILILLNLNNTHIELNKINVRETRRGNQDWRIQRHWQHWAHKTQDEDKQTNQKQNNTDNYKADQHGHDLKRAIKVLLKVYQFL
jgi:hypothetical protein